MLAYLVYCNTGNGNTVIEGTVNVKQGVDFDSTLNVDSDVTFNATLDVDDDATFNDIMIPLVNSLQLPMVTIRLSV